MNKTLRLLSLSLAFLVCVVAQAQSVGWLQINQTTTSEGAEFYVDGKYVTDVPAKVALAPGRHSVILKKPLYLDYKASVTIVSGETSSLSLEMEKNYNYVSISAPLDAQILLDGKVIGVSKWSGNLECGEYMLQAKKEGYLPSSMKLKVEMGRSMTVTLPGMKPVEGRLTVECNLDDCRVYVDGSYVGNTPLKTNVRIGDHLVKVGLPDGASQEKMVTIVEGRTTAATFEGEYIYPVSLTTNISTAKMQIDGRFYEYVNVPKSLAAGKHEVRVMSDGYKGCKKTINVTEGTNDEYFKLKEYMLGADIFQWGLYCNMGYQIARCPGLEFGFGMFLSGFNMEYSGSLGLQQFIFPFMYTDGNLSEYKYRPNLWNIKFGWGLPIGTRLRFTPQLGFGKATFSGTCLSDTEYGYSADLGESYEKVKCGVFTPGARIDIAIAKWLSIYANPSYVLPFKSMNNQSDILQYMVYEYPGLERYLRGFNVSVGLSFNLNMDL